MTIPFLSLIIPAHNEERRLPDTLGQVLAYLQGKSFLAEVLIVENGSRDRTFQIAQDFVHQYSQRIEGKHASGMPRFQLLREDQRGKGLAIKRGMLTAAGEYRFMCDADLSMPVSEINRFLPPILTDFDIAIASREAAGAVRYNEPAYRHLGGRAVNTMIRLFALPGLNDTQCGFKCFRAPVAEDLFRVQTLTNWSFDIEILYVARRRGYRIVELPIPWYFDPETKLSPIRDAVRMWLDILTIQRNARQGKYGPKI